MTDIQDIAQGGVPSQEPNTQTQKPKKEKKKSGAGAKFLCFFLGFLFGILSIFGAVAGGLYYVGTQPIDKSLHTIDNLTGAGLYDTLFGSTDSNGNTTAGLLNEKYAEMKVMELVGDLSDSISGISSKGATLGAFNEISPKIGEVVENLVNKIGEYGIPLSAETMMATPITGENGLLDYLQSSLKDAAAGDLLYAFTGEKLSPLFMSICYGEENIDYTVDEDGKVTMIGDAKKTTIGELTETDISLLFGDIALVDVIGLEGSYNSPITMHLLFGTEGVHYKKVDTNGDGVNDNVEMLRQSVIFFYSLNDSSVIYNDKQVQLSGVSLDTANKLFIDSDGQQYTYTHKGKLTLANGVSVQKCELTKGYYKPHTIADLTGENNVIDTLVDEITIGEVFDAELLDNHIFLKHVKNETIKTLPDKINQLYVTEVYADEVFKSDGTLKGSWKYLLTDPKTGKIDNTITVIDMQKMIDNMQENIHLTPLRLLKKDGVLPEISDSTLNTKIKTTIVGQSIGISFPGCSTLGDLTVDQMLIYIDAVLSKLPD